MTSYISLLSKIEAFCNAHLQIKKYGGEFREQMPNFATKDEKYPVVFVTPTSDTEALNTNQFTVDIYCVDIIQADRTNLNSIISDCQLILKDMYVYYTNDNDVEIDVVGTASMTPLNNQDLDYVAGWVMSITFEVASYGDCAIPMNPINPTPTPSCEDATQIITDSNGNELYVNSIPSGATETQVIQDSTYLVEYVNGTLIESGNILAEGSVTVQVPNPVTCADATVNVNGAFWDNVPSGGTENVIVRQSSGSTEVGSIQGQYFRIDDSIAVLKDTLGTTISTTSIKAEDTENIILPDETITITDELGNPLDVITFPVYSTVNIDIDSYVTPCADATYDLEDSLGGALSSGSIPSGTNDVIVAPDATVENSNTSYTDTVVSGGTLILPDTDIEVNGVNEGIIPSVQTADIQLTDGLNPVTPNDVTVVGNTVTIEVPAASAPVGATLMRTGQTTVYRTGDDADTSSEGRPTDFFTLASNNPFGNTDRFTDELGTQTYTNNIVIDWSTYDGATVLGYRRTDNGGAFANWTQAIDGALAVSIGTFTTGWRLPNIKELLNVSIVKTTSNIYNYSPFNLVPSLTPALWSSTRASGQNAYLRVLTTNGAVDVQGSSTVAKYIPCRTFTVTGTILT